MQNMGGTQISQRKSYTKESTPKANHAESLADQGKLPGYANTGTMTYTEFLTLPKPHQRNKIKKVLHEMHGLKDKDTVSYLPTVGQKARSYSLLGNSCTVQTGVITAYTGDTENPYQLTSEADPNRSLPCDLAHLRERIVGPDGLTKEEESLKDKLLVKFFEAEELSPQERLKQKRKKAKGKKIREVKGMTLFHGGITNVQRDGDSTVVSILYNDLDKEDLDLSDLLEQVAFKEDPMKKQRIEELKLRYLNISHFGPTRNAGRLSTSRKAKQHKQHKQNKSAGSQKHSTTSRTTRSHDGAATYKNTGSSSYQNWEQQGLFPP